MKSLAWLALLLGLVFGIGWTSRLLAERAFCGVVATAPDSARGSAAAGAPFGPDRDRDRDRSRSRDGFGPTGPFLATVEQFAGEIGLDDAQRLRLDELIAETTREVERHEESIRDVLRRTHTRVAELLTAEQHEKMGALVAAERAAHAQEKRERTMAWIRENLAPDGAALAAIESIIEEYDARKAALFESFRAAETWPDEKVVHEQIEALRAERDAALAGHLAPDALEQLKAQWTRGRGPHR